MSTRPTIPPSNIYVKWHRDEEARLLELIKARDEWICLFAEGQQLKDKWLFTRELLLALWPEAEGDEKRLRWMRDAQKRGLVTIVDGRWVPTELWGSKVSNPVQNKIAQWIRIYREAEKKYSIEPEWTSFDEMPREKRLLLVTNFPLFFTIRSLVNHPFPETPQALPALPIESHPRPLMTSRTVSRAKRRRIIYSEDEDDDVPDAPKLERMEESDDEILCLGVKSEPFDNSSRLLTPASTKTPQPSQLHPQRNSATTQSVPRETSPMSVAMPRSPISDELGSPQSPRYEEQIEEKPSVNVSMPFLRYFRRYESGSEKAEAGDQPIRSSIALPPSTHRRYIGATELDRNKPSGWRTSLYGKPGRIGTRQHIFVALRWHSDK